MHIHVLLAGSASAARSVRTSPAAPTACRTCATSRAATASAGATRSTSSRPSRRRCCIIHGFLGTRGSMYMLERRLVEDGFVVRVVQPRHAQRPRHPRSAFLIHRKIERILAQTPSQRIDIIGHSMGGLIGLYYVKKLGGHARVRKLIMMGTPVRGHLGGARRRGHARPVVDVVVAAAAAQPVPRRARPGPDAARRRGLTPSPPPATGSCRCPRPALPGRNAMTVPLGPLQPGGLRGGLPPARQHAAAHRTNHDRPTTTTAESRLGSMTGRLLAPIAASGTRIFESLAAASTSMNDRPRFALRFISGKYQGASSRSG